MKADFEVICASREVCFGSCIFLHRINVEAFEDGATRTGALSGGAADASKLSNVFQHAGKVQVLLKLEEVSS